MGRWDDRDALNEKEKREFVRDEWNKAFDNDFDWKETPYKEHPKNCKCPKHEYFEEQKKNNKSLPRVLRYCPQHYKAYWETFDEHMKKCKWWERILVKIAFRFKWIIIKELKHSQADLCLWCKFGSGGRGISVDPLKPDIP